MIDRKYFSRLITRSRYEDITKFRKISKLNSKLFLPKIFEQFQKRVEAYNKVVTEVYGSYIDNVTRYLRSINDQHKEILPFSSISFSQDLDYDDGSFEYNLHHHQSQQTNNPSISPFAGVSGLTHNCFMSNYNPIIGSWDLVYDLDLSSRVVPFIDIESRDHTNVAYHLNSYALDFFIHGSEKLLMIENRLEPGDIYNLLLDFNLVLSSITTSLEVIIENDKTQSQTKDSSIIRELYTSISSVKDTFSRNFRIQYPSRNQL